MNTNKLISVIIPLYNKEKYVAETIKSVLNQTYANFELIIVNDGSTDNSLKVVEKFKDKRIRIFSKENGGQSNTRNYGIKKSKGAFFTFIDADDMWYKDHLTNLYNVFLQHNDDNIFCDKYTSDKKTNFLENDTITIIEKNNILNYFYKSQFLFSLCNCLIKKKHIEEYSLNLEEELSIGEDINFILKLNQYSKIYLINKYGLFYNRDDEDSMMNKLSKYRSLPHYFKNVAIDKYTSSEKKEMKKFLQNEYLKIAFQNRDVKMSFQEIKDNIFKINLSILDKIKYLIIRFIPKILMNKLKKYKGF